MKKNAVISTGSIVFVPKEDGRSSLHGTVTKDRLQPQQYILRDTNNKNRQNSNEDYRHTNATPILTKQYVQDQ